MTSSDLILIHDLLIQARALVTAGWAQFDFCQTQDGTPTFCDSPTASRWGLDGAIWQVAAKGHMTLLPEIWTFLSAQLPAPFPPNLAGITAYNDAPETTQTNVLALLDRTIAALPTGGPS